MISPLADKVILTPYHHDVHGSNGTITRVVIHGTVSPCVVGGAENNAHYFQSASAGGAAHYVVDPETIVACVDEDQKAAHAPPNAGSIGIELCDPQTGDGARWNDDDHRKMLELAAKLTADICARYNLPLVWRSPDQLRAGNAGITSHANVAQAWHQSDHTDPGPDFDSDAFIASLTPSPPGDEDMPAAPAIVIDGPEEWSFVRGLSGELFARNKAKDWFSLGGQLTSGPSASVVADGRIVVNVRGADGATWRLVIDKDGGITEDWTSLGGQS